jgi:hypothetical protein
MRRQIIQENGQRRTITVRPGKVVAVDGATVTIGIDGRERKVSGADVRVAKWDDLQLKAGGTSVLRDGDAIEVGAFGGATIIIRLKPEPKPKPEAQPEAEPEPKPITIDDVRDVLVLGTGERQREFDLLPKTEQDILLFVAWDTKHEGDADAAAEGRDWSRIEAVAKIEGLSEIERFELKYVLERVRGGATTSTAVDFERLQQLALGPAVSTLRRNSAFLPKERLRNWLTRWAKLMLVERHLDGLDVPKEQHAAITLEYALMYRPVRAIGVSRLITLRGYSELPEAAKTIVRANRSAFGLDPPSRTVEWLLGDDE